MSDDYLGLDHLRDVPELRALIGRTLVEITSQDADDYHRDGESFICLHFDNGTTITVPVGDCGFDIETI